MRALAWVPFPTPGAPKRRTGPGRKSFSARAVLGSVIMLVVKRLRSLPALAATNAATLGSEAVVVAHDELRFDLLGGVHGDADDDQQRGAAKVEVDAEAIGHPGGEAVKDRADEPDMVEVDSADEQGRNDSDDDEVESADQRDAGEHVVDEVGGALAGADAGDEAAVLAHVVGDVVRTEDNGDIKIREENNCSDLEDLVPGLAGCDGAEDRAKERRVLQGIAEDVSAGKEQRRRQNGAGEDDRHHAAGVDLEGEVGRLAAHHLAADDALGVLDGNAAL